MARSLTCDICSRTQVVGIMSAQSWGTVNGSARIGHACPQCQEKHPDWHEQLVRLVSVSG